MYRLKIQPGREISLSADRNRGADVLCLEKCCMAQIGNPDIRELEKNDCEGQDLEIWGLENYHSGRDPEIRRSRDKRGSWTVPKHI